MKHASKPCPGGVGIRPQGARIMGAVHIGAGDLVGDKIAARFVVYERQYG